MFTFTTTSTGAQAKSHPFIPAGPKDSRSPCPALNALANQGYIPRSGQNITLFQLISALRYVYNISLPLATLLTLSGLITCGHLQLTHHTHLFGLLKLNLTLNLDALNVRGPTKIAHDASLVHADGEKGECKPDPVLVQDLVDDATSTKTTTPGLTLNDLAYARVQRENTLPGPKHTLDNLHSQIALGEAGLTWLIMAQSYPTSTTTFTSSCTPTSCIPTPRAKQFLGEERLPDGWWAGVRPKKTVGLLEARRKAGEVGTQMGVIRREEGVCV